MKAFAADPEPISILVVEDDFLIREWVADSLSEQGFAVHRAGSAAEALRILGVAAVDVLFTDINLPGAMDGMTLARRARELVPDVCVVYASARMMPEPQARVPGSIFVPKPYVPTLIGRLLADARKTATVAVPA